MFKMLLSKFNAKNKYEELQIQNFQYVELQEKIVTQLREKIVQAYTEIKKTDSSEYVKDVKFGIELYEILNKENWFTKSLSSNYDFWRYVSLTIMPDIIYDRYGDIQSHFYDKNVRIYPATLYWYINLFKKETKAETFKFLSLPCFSTDTILQTIERTGNETNIDVLREILNQYSKLDIKTIKNKYCPMNIFLRRILMQHMARSLVIIPELYQDGITGYVKMLINSVLNEGSND